jgi:hypothetical protein
MIKINTSIKTILIILLSNIYNKIEHKFYNLYTVVWLLSDPLR